MIVNRLSLCFVVLLFVSCYHDEDCSLNIEYEDVGVLYDRTFNDVGSVGNDFIEFQNSHNYCSNIGLVICDTLHPVILDRAYSLSEREVEYKCIFSNNSVVEFFNLKRGVRFVVEMAKKQIWVNDQMYSVDFIMPDREYSIIQSKSYQEQKYIIIDNITGERVFDVISYNDGPGGFGQGVINKNSTIYEMPHGNYCISLKTGNPVVLKSIKIQVPLHKVFLLIYGDSISEPESYYPSNSFSLAWTSLIRKDVPGTITCGWGGGTIDDIMISMKSELPYLDVEYVMITIGTNGGNTLEKLSEMIEYLLSLNIIPILNHIPCNDDNTQVVVNKMIDEIRAKYGINGVDFDKATSTDGDGQLLDKSKMFWEDYGPDYILVSKDYWHHPNEKGSKAMYEQFYIDMPEFSVYNK